MSAKEMSGRLVRVVESLPQSAFWDMELIREIMWAAAEIDCHIKAGTVPDEKSLFGWRLSRYMEVCAI